MPRRKLNLKDRYAALKRIDLMRMFRDHFNRDDIRLGYVTCPFHDDTHPSLLITRFDNIFRYKCKSDSCGANGTAWTFMEEELKLTDTHAKAKYVLEKGYILTSEDSDTPIEKLVEAFARDSSYEQEFAAIHDNCMAALTELTMDPNFNDIFQFMTDKFVIDITHCQELDIGIFDLKRISTLGLSAKFLKQINFDVTELKDPHQKCVVTFLRSSTDTISGFILCPIGGTSKTYRQFSYKGVHGYGGLHTLDMDGINRDNEYTLVVEGFSDMSMIQSRCLAEYGRTINCISVCGTSGINNMISLGAIETVVQHTGGNLVIWPDNDPPGIEALHGMCRHLADLNIKASIMYPPRYQQGEDPADYCRKFSVLDFNTKFVQAIAKCRYSLPEFYYRYASEQAYQTNIENDAIACAKLYVDHGIEAKLSPLDLDIYCSYVAHGKRDVDGTEAYPVLVSTTKETLLAEISNDVDSAMELQILDETYVLLADAICRITTKEDSNGNERRVTTPLTNFSFRLKRLVLDRKGTIINYIGDLVHEKPQLSRRNILISKEEYEPAKFLRALAAASGGASMHYPSQQAAQQRVRDVCLHLWSDVEKIMAITKYGYTSLPEDGFEDVYIAGTHLITKTGIIENEKFHMELSKHVEGYGYDQMPFTSQNELNASIRYCLQNIILKLFDAGYEKNAMVPFMCALAAPLWHLNPNDKRFVLFTAGPFSSGKTNVQRAMRALQYKFEGSLTTGLSHNSTANFLEKAVSNMNDHVVIIDDYKDELSQGGGRPILSLIQSLYDGVGRGRLTKDLSIAETHSSRCMVMMNGEDFPSIAQGSAYDRVLLQSIDGGHFQYGPLAEISDNPAKYHQYQGWFPAFIQYAMAFGPERNEAPFIDGPGRSTQHGKVCYRAWTTFKQFCIVKAGFSADDSLLTSMEKLCRDSLAEVVGATAEKATSESKWEIFRRSISVLVKSDRMIFKTPTMPRVTSNIHVGGFIYPSGKDTIVALHPETCVQAMKKELSRHLTVSAVYNSMRSDGVLLSIRSSDNSVISSDEKHRWLVRASHFFDETADLVKYVEGLNRFAV